MLRTSIAASALIALAACGAPPEQEAEPTPADTVAMALAAYDATAFDSIAWETPDEAVVRGSVVFQYSCAKCHGTQGYGDGEFVTRGDTLQPPSFHDEAFQYRGDLEGLRRHVFTGTANGMPHWGMEGLKYRDIDAVGRFILDRFAGG